MVSTLLKIVMCFCAALILFAVSARYIESLVKRRKERELSDRESYRENNEMYLPIMPLPENWSIKLDEVVREFSFEFETFKYTAPQNGINEGAVTTFETLEDPRIPRTGMHEAWEARREKNRGKVIYFNKFSKEIAYSFPKNYLNDPMALVNMRVTLLENDDFLRCENFPIAGVHASSKSDCDKKCDTVCYNHGYWFYDFPTHSMMCFTRYEKSKTTLLADSRNELYRCTCGHNSYRYSRITALKKFSSFVECSDSKPLLGKLTRDFRKKCHKKCDSIYVMLKEFFPTVHETTSRKSTKKDKDVRQGVIRCYDQNSKQELHSRRLSGRCDSRLGCHCGMPEKYLNRDSLMHIESATLHPIESLGADEGTLETSRRAKKIKNYTPGEPSDLQTHGDIRINLKNDIMEEISENSST